MDFIHGKIRPIYFKYLAAAFGSALVTSIYSIVDMAMVGQYQGPDGTAALAVVAPIWNIIYSLGLLMGIGGAVIFSTIKGQGSQKDDEAGEVFTVSVIGSILLAFLLSWFVIVVFDQPLLTFFGAEKNLLPLGLSYLKPIQFVVPCFLFNQMLAAYLRNDNDPALATAGPFWWNIQYFGDYVFVFVFDMGIYGAGLATAIGAVISTLVMLTHF